MRTPFAPAPAYAIQPVISLEAALATGSLSDLVAFAAFVLPAPIEALAEEERCFSVPPTVPVSA